VKLLAAASYDPAVAVTKATTALLAMTAIDTTNLRRTVTVPDHGMLRWRIIAPVHGATTLPSLLLGVLEGATVRGRIAPMVGGGNLIASGRYQHEATGVITGLTPGANITLDAAYGVEVVVAATGIKYGGPNNTTTNDAFGAIVFELFDPAPAAGAGGGATAAEVWAHGARTLTANPGVSAADVRTQADAALAAVGVTTTVTGRIDAAVSTRSTYAGADTAGTTTLLSRLTATRATAIDNLDATVSSRLATAGYTAPPSVAAIRGEIDTNSTKLDAAISTRMATFTYTTPPSAAAIRAEMDLNSTKLANLDAAVSSRLAATAYTEPDNVSVAAIKLKTDQLHFEVPNCLRVDVCHINGVRVTGAGTTADKWRPAV
jgi:hypothetical protein